MNKKVRLVSTFVVFISFLTIWEYGSSIPISSFVKDVLVLLAGFAIPAVIIDGKSLGLKVTYLAAGGLLGILIWSAFTNLTMIIDEPAVAALLAILFIFLHGLNEFVSLIFRRFSR